VAEEAEFALSASERFYVPRCIALKQLRPILPRLGAGLAAIVLALAAAQAAAQSAKKGLPWAELNSEQQQILAPLAPPHWDQLDPDRKRKWLGIAKRYPSMNPTEQKRVQTRMQKWAALTPEQRREAREKYRRMEKLPPEKRDNLSERWSEYQSLPPHQRQGLVPQSPAAERKRGTAKPPKNAPADAAKQ
jgi:hypothetical protein